MVGPFIEELCSAWEVLIKMIVNDLRICIYLCFFLFQSEHKWKQLAELAISKCQFQLAQECLINAQDFGGLLLLATSAGDSDMILRLAETSAKKGKNNVAFLAYFLLGR